MAYSYYADVLKSMRMIPFAEEYYKKTIETCDNKECKDFYQETLNTMLIERRKQELQHMKEILSVKEYKVPNLDERKWKLGNIVISKGHLLAEFILANENIENWSELYTQEILYKEAYDTNPNNYLEKTAKLHKQTAENLGRTFYEKVIFKDSEKVLYVWGYGKGYENNLFYLYWTPEALYKLSYAKKTPFTEEEIKKWFKIFQQ